VNTQTKYEVTHVKFHTPITIGDRHFNEIYSSYLEDVEIEIQAEGVAIHIAEHHVFVYSSNITKVSLVPKREEESAPRRLWNRIWN
jgi:hypothetical protein